MKKLIFQNLKTTETQNLKSVWFLLVVAVLGFVVASAQPTDMRRAVSVEGEASASVSPDRASITIGVETEGMDVSAIKAENDKRVKAIFTSLKSLGLTEKEIQTADLQIHPQFDYTSGKRKLTSYVMRNVVFVTVKDLSKLDKIINAGVGSGSNVLDNVSFSVSNAKHIRDSLRVEAVRDAMSKATALATAAGAKVARVMSIEENQSSPVPVPMYRSAQMMKVESDNAGTETSAGQMVIEVSVAVKVGLE